MHLMTYEEDTPRRVFTLRLLAFNIKVKTELDLGPTFANFFLCGLWFLVGPGSEGIYGVNSMAAR